MFATTDRITRRDALKAAAATVLTGSLSRIGKAASPAEIPVQYRPHVGHFWDHWLWRGPDGVVWTASRFEGPYELAGDWSLFRGQGCYIAKIVEAPDGGDVVLTIRMAHLDSKPAFGLAPAYRVSYPREGGIRVHLDQRLTG